MFLTKHNGHLLISSYADNRVTLFGGGRQHEAASIEIDGVSHGVNTHANTVARLLGEPDLLQPVL